MTLYIWLDRFYAIFKGSCRHQQRYRILRFRKQNNQWHTVGLAMRMSNNTCSILYMSYEKTFDPGYRHLNDHLVLRVSPKINPVIAKYFLI